jgi:hypothetical protein
MTTVEEALRQALAKPESPNDTLADRVREIADSIKYGKHGLWVNLDIEMDEDQLEHLTREANALVGTIKSVKSKERWHGALLTTEDVNRVGYVFTQELIERAERRARG